METHRGQRRARRIFMGMAVVLATFAALGGPEVWRLITTKRFHSDSLVAGHPTRGWYTVKRWSTDGDLPILCGEAIQYFTENGRIATRTEHRTEDSYRQTWWNLDGTVHSQTLFENGVITKRVAAPPWLWGATDRVEPVAPWWRDGPP